MGSFAFEEGILVPREKSFSIFEVREFWPVGIFNTGNGSRALSFFAYYPFFHNGNVGAGYGFCTFAMESANQNSPYDG